MQKLAEIRLYALELTGLDASQVVKTAGVLRKIKKFLKKIFDPEYRAQIEDFDRNTEQLQTLSKDLNNKLDQLQTAIGNGDLEDYKQKFIEIKELTGKFWIELKQINENGDKVEGIISSYTAEEAGSPDFEAQIRVKMPSNFDLKFGNQNIKLKETKWFGLLKPQDIFIQSGTTSALSHFLREVRRILKGHRIDEEEIDYILQSKELIENFREGILQGTVAEIQPKIPKEKTRRIKAGQLDVRILTAPFIVPGTPIALTGEVILVDSRPIDPNRSLSLAATKNLGTALSQANQVNELEKLSYSSQHVAYQVTVLSELDLAKALKEGYRLAFGHDPTAEVLGIAWAQVVLEAGRPIKLPVNNIGNIKASNDWIKSGLPFFIKSTQENTSTGKSFIHQEAKWRAYASPVEGAVGYWKFIGKNYKEALDWMAAGEPQSASVALAMRGYFTANIQRYAKGVGNLYQEFMTKIAPQISNLPSLPAAPPGEKPLVKNWISEYSSAEKSSILNKSNSAPVTQTDSIDSLINTLYADEPITKMVKLAKCEEILPKIAIKLEFSKNCPKSEHALNIIIPEILGAIKTKNGFEIIGMPLTVLGAVQALCDCVSSVSGISIVSRMEVV